MNIKVSFQTLHLPPPFAHAFVLDMTSSETSVKLSYELEYLHRDTVSQEEVLGEGYSLNDDYQWTGSLGQSWAEALKQKVGSVELQAEAEEPAVYIHMEITDGYRQQSGIITKDLESWDLWLQELIQAILEKAEKELPLKMHFLNCQDGNKEAFELKGSFEHREATINNKSMEWSQMFQLLEDVYMMDFEGVETVDPTENGLWIAPTEDTYYFHFDQQAGPKAKKIKERILHTLRFFQE